MPMSRAFHRLSVRSPAMDMVCEGTVSFAAMSCAVRRSLALLFCTQFRTDVLCNRWSFWGKSGFSG